MSADIVERLEYARTQLEDDVLDFLYLQGGNDSKRYKTAQAINVLLREAAAEIGRLRGEVENITAEAIEWRDKLQASTPAPAMPNGVEWRPIHELDPSDDLFWFFRGDTVDGPREQRHDDSDYWDFFAPVKWPPIPALRAADNRDAAGVCDCPGIGKADKALHAPNCRVRTAPAAVPAGEAVAFVAVPDDYRNQASGYRAGWTDAMKCTPQPADGEAVAKNKWAPPYPDAAKDPFNALLTTPPPAPGQAAPQAAQVQQEAVATVCYDNSIALVDATIDLPQGTKLYTRPSACELGAVRELVAKWRNRRNVGDFNYTPDHPALIAIRECADELEAALQHRGDSRGGEASGG